MGMTNLNISLPESMRSFVESRVKSGDYGTISEYLRDLIRAEQGKEQRLFDQLVKEGIESGPSEPFDKADIEKARAEIRRRLSEK